MIEKEDGRYCMYCNSCGDDGPKHKDFRTMVASAKELEWRITKNKGTQEWEHYCQVCWGPEDEL